MLFTPSTLVLIGLGLVVGALIGYVIRKQVAKTTNANAEARAEQILSEAKAKQQEVLQEAKNKRQELTLEAKEAAIKIIEEAKREETARRNELQEIQKRLEKREGLFDQKLIEFEDKKTKLEEKTQIAEERKLEIEIIKEEQGKKLQQIAGLSREQALEQLMHAVEETSQEALMSRIRKLDQATEEEIEAQGRKVLSLAISRFASSQCVDTTTTSVELPSDEMKGRIIGKEGRNIKAIEIQTKTKNIFYYTPNNN